MIPITLKEKYINEIVGGGDTAPETPQTREELFFAEILGEVIAPSPVTRTEKYLSAIAGKYNGDLPTPITRIEYFLARAAGMDVNAPTPVTREEMFWDMYTAAKEIIGTLPLTFKARKSTTLDNYRIYGNTVNGESVGEKTANLFDGEIEQGGMRVNDGAEVDSDYRIRTKKISVKPITTYTLSSHLYIRTICLYNDGVFVSTEVDRPMNANHQITLTMPNNANQIQIVFKNSATDTTDNSALITPDDFEWGMLNSGSTALPYEPYGYRVPVTVEAKNLCNNIWEQKAINADSGNAIPNENTVCCDFIPVKPNVTYSCSRTIWNNYNNLRCYGTNKNYLGTGTDLANKGNPLIQGAPFGTFMITDARVSYIRFNDLSNSLDTKYMLVEGIYTAETMPPYEPYHAPITTPIYLPEPIKMVGDEAEYIDYGQQKQHFADGTESSVTLPEISTLAGTNTLTVGTEVQPSNVYIKYEGER